MSELVYVGIDVSKAELEVACYPQKGRRTFANNDAGIGTLRRQLLSHVIGEARPVWIGC